VDHTIELIRLGSPMASRQETWRHGGQQWIDRSIPAVAGVFDRIARAEDPPDAVLLMDAAFALPDGGLLARLLDGPADVWHGGVALGLGDQPRSWDRVDPLSMFSAPVDPSVEVTSWRVSLRAALIHSEVIRQLGAPDPDFETLSGAGLDLGLRWIRSGALVRHVPSLVSADAEPELPPTVGDGLRLVARHRGRMWAGWAFLRGLRQEIPIRSVVASARRLRTTEPPALVHYAAPEERQVGGDTDRTVSVILPTVDRYSYLEPLLQQLAAQTIAPHQVIVADQTPLDHRRHDLASVAPSLPLSVIELGEPGQCTSRNAAIAAATGEFLLFIDDDDDVPVDLIEGHLSRMLDGVDASSGAVDDATAGPPPVGFRHRRASDVFPTNNTLLRRSALVPTGLFDPAYDRGARADHDLGMRLHLSGAQLVYDPSIEVFHHHAPVGGLRTHGARKVTRAGSRRSLTQRHLPSLTERYLAHRYFRPDQAGEGLVISALSQLGGDGPRWRRVARAALQLVLMPSTVRALRCVDRDARALLTRRPPIPDLPPLVSEPADR